MVMKLFPSDSLLRSYGLRTVLLLRYDKAALEFFVPPAVIGSLHQKVIACQIAFGYTFAPLL